MILYFGNQYSSFPLHTLNKEEMRGFVQANTRTKRDRLIFYLITLFLVASFCAVLYIIFLLGHPSGIYNWSSSSSCNNKCL